MSTDKNKTANTNKRLAIQAYDTLIDLILSKELKQGELVQERSLALRLGLSRTPIREAMHRLEGERILERNTSNLLFVRVITLEEIIQTLYVRRLLESDAAARAAGKIPQTKLMALKERIHQAMQSTDTSHQTHQEIDHDLHHLISEYAENDIMANMINDLRRQTTLFSLKRLENRIEAVCHEHLEIIDALAAGDANTAASVTRQHIDQIKQAIINKLTHY